MVAVAYDGRSFTRGSNIYCYSSNLTGKILALRYSVGVCLQEVAAHGGLTVLEFSNDCGLAIGKRKELFLQKLNILLFHKLKWCA